MKLKDHPTVKLYEAAKLMQPTSGDAPLSSSWLQQLCLDAGADDVGFVHIDNPHVAEQRDDILELYPKTKTLVSVVVKMNKTPVRSVSRAIANREFHTAGHDVDEILRHMVRRIEDEGLEALNPSMAFPMEMERFPDAKTFYVSHKPVAEAAGLGVMGIHRNVIHPKFGNFILLGTLLLPYEVTEYGRLLDYNPCFECKLCVAVCPVGAIHNDGHFNATACLNHNYREFFGGFVEWAEQLANSSNKHSYREEVTPTEDATRWQSLTYGANYKSAYCMAVCPAGEDVIGPYLDNKRAFLQEMVKPLQKKEETIYVSKNSDALAFTKKRYPHKAVKVVDGGVHPQTIAGFLWGSEIAFQRGQSEGLNATFHFKFLGKEAREVTFDIRDKQLIVSEGLVGTADLQITADSEAWIDLLNERLNPVWGVLRRKIRFKGDPRLLLHFQRCFG